MNEKSVGRKSARTLIHFLLGPEYESNISFCCWMLMLNVTFLLF
jgi:hypothetical protein